MGRKKRGWRIRQREEGWAYSVIFTHGGRPYERSTGTSDPDEAAREAARIYARIVQSAPEPPRRRKAQLNLEELVAQWLTSLSGQLDDDTIECYSQYAASHWLEHFRAVHDLTSGMCSEYVSARLRKVQAATVRKESSALRRFVSWLRETRSIDYDVTVPGVPKRALGTPYGKRRRAEAIELDPDEVWSIIELLPEWAFSTRTRTRYPVRSRFVVAYETSLRPATISALSVPEHYRKGRLTLTMTRAIDKNRMGRELDLTERAREALDSVCPKQGLIFGQHDYREPLRIAAAKVLDKDRLDRFCGAHLRSARITHWAERSKNLAGIQYNAGHKHLSTTAKYVKASRRAGRALLDEMNSDD